jgi:hypothetical protein
VVKPKSLESFSATFQPAGRFCWTCSLAQKAEIDKGLTAGISPSVVAHWLSDECKMAETHGIIQRRIAQHRRAGHHTKVAK